MNDVPKLQMYGYLKKFKIYMALYLKEKFGKLEF